MTTLRWGHMHCRTTSSSPIIRLAAAPTARVSCCCLKNKQSMNIPKLEPFSRGKFDRILRDPPLIKKTENDLADYCSTLEGDSSYSCWKAYFELKELEKEAPKEEVEKVILESGGVKSLIGYLHGISEIHKARKKLQSQNESNTSGSNLVKVVSRARSECPVPDGLPKSLEEMEEEEKWKMPDSSFTRLLRSKGKSPAWFSPVPDHETD
uniref:CCG-binding protein 1 n=1 Tax=Erigeron canadensis TaxID=72917 RepID=UPI001CB9CA47|nr:CCG-binding protein 1 [Erigeron canadensis]